MMAQAICYAIVYIIEAVIAWLYHSYLHEQKHRTGFVLLMYAIGHLLLFVVSQAVDIIIVNTFSFFVINVFLTLLCFVCGFWAAVMHSALLAFVMSICEILVALGLSFVTGSFGAYKSNFVVLVALSGISKLLYFLASMLIAFLFKPHKVREKDPVTVLLLSAMPLATMLVADEIIYIGMTVSLQPATAGLMVVSVFALMGVNLLVLVVYNNVQKITRENTHLQLMLQRDETEAHMYRTLRTQYDTQRELIHDIRHHQYVLTDMLRQGESAQALDYLEKMSELPAVKKRTLYCRNPILNTIVQRYAEQCQQTNIQFQCDIAAACIDYLDDISITALFSNLLSNAYTAAGKSQDRYIDLSVGPTRTGDVVITVLNSCDIPPAKGVNGRFRTTKGDTLHHGIGLDSIARVVKQYGGSVDMNYHPDTKSVSTSVFLPRRASVIIK